MRLVYFIFVFLSLSFCSPKVEWKATEQFQSSTPFVTWQFSWDNSTLYFGLNDTTAVAGAIVYIDTDPYPNPLSGSGSSIVTADARNADVKLPFMADFAITIDNGTLSSPSLYKYTASSGSFPSLPSFKIPYSIRKNAKRFELHFRLGFFLRN